MKKTILFLLSVLILTMYLSAVVCQGASISTGAQAAILWDADTDTALYEYNANQRLPMASTTKIMTAIVALEQKALTSLVTIPAEAVGIEGSSCYLKEGEILSLHSLLYALLLQSANDAAEAIAIYVAGNSENFALLMNLKAAELGLSDTHFDNPHGLDSEQHYTTARDLAKLADYCMQNSDFCRIWSTASICIPLSDDETAEHFRHLYNHNKLLRSYQNCVGGKTGYTMRCGRCLVSAAEENGRTLVAVTLNDRSDWADHILMYRYGFETIQEEKELSTWKKSAYKNISPIAD